MRRLLPWVPLLFVLIGLLFFFEISKTSTSRICTAELESVSADDAGRSYASIAALVPDFRDNYKSAAASWLVSPGLLPPYEILILENGEDWSAQLRFVDLNEHPIGSQDRAKTLATQARSIPLGTGLAKGLVDLWRRTIEHPIKSGSRDQILDGAGFLVGVGGKWAYTYSPSCGLPNAFVRTGAALEKAIRAGSEKERGEKLLNLDQLIVEAQRQLSTEVTTN